MATNIPLNHIGVGAGPGVSGMLDSGVNIDPATQQMNLAKILSTASNTARALETRFAEKVNALDWGMVNDGAMTSNTIGGTMTGTDNTAAFQAVLDYIGQNGKVLYIPPGMYRFADPGVVGHSVLLNYNTYLLEGSPGETFFLIDDNGLANTAGANLIDTAGSSTSLNLRSLFYLSGIGFWGRFSQINESTWDGTFTRGCIQPRNFMEARVDNCRAFDIRGDFNSGQFGQLACISNSYFDRIARGSINRFLDWDHVIEIGNTIKHCDDGVDSPVNFSGANPIRSELIIANNTYEQVVGTQCFGAKSMIIVGNTMKFPMGAGFTVGGQFGNDDGCNAATNCIIANNTIENVIARWSATTSSLLTIGSTDYANSGIVISGIPMNQTTSPAYPGYSTLTAIVDPLGQDTNGDFFPWNFTDSVTVPDKSAPQSFGLMICNNTVVNTLAAVAQPFATWNFDYANAPGMFTKQGWQNPTFSLNNLGLNGITLSSDVRGALISGNVVAGYRSGTGIFLDASSTADVTKSFYGITISNNVIQDCWTGIGHSRRGNATLVNWPARVINNSIDVDPYFVQPARNVSFNGGWQAAIAAASQPVAIALSGVTGWDIQSNRIRNCYAPVLVSSVLQDEALCLNNILECTPIDVGFFTTNIGIGTVPPGGPEFQFIIVLSNPSGSTYGNLTNVCRTSSSSIPTAGRYVAGTFVANNNPTISGGSITFGWSRLTTGSGHVSGTDWKPLVL